MADYAPSSYAELISVLNNLPVLVREKRRREGLSVRKAAVQIGVSFATVARCEQGEDLALSNATALLTWIAAPAVQQTPGDQR